MSKPTTIEAVNLVREHFGLSLTEAMAVLRTPLHPAGLRDDLAAKAIGVAWDAYDKGYCGEEADRINVEIVAEAAYSIADAMLAARGAAE